MNTPPPQTDLTRLFKRVEETKKINRSDEKNTPSDTRDDSPISILCNLRDFSFQLTFDRNDANRELQFFMSDISPKTT
jgi:hypothetical protein